MNRMSKRCGICGSDQWHAANSQFCLQRLRENELKAAEQRAITDAVRWLYDNGHKSAAVALEARDKR